MTIPQAQQINAYMMLNRAFWHVFKDTFAAIALLDARGRVANEMDSASLLTAITLCQQLEELERAA